MLAIMLIDGTPGEELLLAFTTPVHFNTLIYTFAQTSVFGTY
jgi:hypothetical protein